MPTVDVRITSMYPPGEVGSIRGYASATIDSCLAIRGIKVMDGGERGLFISMPSRKTTEGIRKCVSRSRRSLGNSFTMQCYQPTSRRWNSLWPSRQVLPRRRRRNRRGNSPACRCRVQGVLFLFLLLAASFVDLKRREIPDWVSGSIAALSLMYVRPECLLGLIPALFFLAAAVKGGIGGGDVKLVAACGLVLGCRVPDRNHTGTSAPASVSFGGVVCAAAF